MAAKKGLRKGQVSSKKTSAKSRPSKPAKLAPKRQALVDQIASKDRELEELRQKLKQAEERAEKAEIKEKVKNTTSVTKALEAKAQKDLERLESRANEERKLVEREEKRLAQEKAVRSVLKGKKKKKKAAIYRPEDKRPERPEIKEKLPPRKVRRKPRIKVVGESIAERLQRADEMIELLKDQKKKLREDLRKLERLPGISDEKKALADEAADKIRGFLDNVKEELKLDNLESNFRVVANRDATVDAELRIPIVMGTSVDRIRDILILLEETIGNGIPETQWLSVGFTADPKVNEEGVLRSAREYIAHEGEVRFNTAYQSAEQQSIVYGFLIGEKALTGFVNAYGPKVTGILIRIAWSQSGRLFRLNDLDLRKPRKSRKGLRKP